MATWTIQVNGQLAQGSGASGTHATTLGEAQPGDFDGATINSVSVSGTPTAVSNGTTNDTIGVRFWIQTSAAVDVYGSNSANTAICSATLGDSVASDTIADDSSTSPAPGTAVAADWDNVAWAINYINNAMPDGETIDWDTGAGNSFNIVVDYTAAAAGGPNLLSLLGVG